MRLQWGADQECAVETTDGLDRLLDQIADAHERPVLVALQAPSGSLTMGVGHPTETVLLYAPAAPGAAPLHSVGARGEEDPPLICSHSGRSIEFSRGCVVPIATGRRAMRAFFEGEGRLPDEVDWDSQLAG
jgi:hypothetical protein